VSSAWSSKGTRKERRFLTIVGEECEAARAKPSVQRREPVNSGSGVRD
jgi:hypothetical protein